MPHLIRWGIISKDIEMATVMRQLVDTLVSHPHPMIQSLGYALDESSYDNILTLSKKLGLKPWDYLLPMPGEDLLSIFTVDTAEDATEDATPDLHGATITDSGLYLDGKHIATGPICIEVFPTHQQITTSIYISSLEIDGIIGECPVTRIVRHV